MVINIEILECWVKELFVYFNYHGNSSFSNTKILYNSLISNLNCDIADEEQWAFCLNLDKEICSSVNPLQCNKKCQFLQCSSENSSKNSSVISEKSLCLPSIFKEKDLCGGKTFIHKCGFSFPEEKGENLLISSQNGLLAIFMIFLAFLLIFLWIYRIYENLSMNPFSKPFFLEKSIIDDIFQLNNQIHIAIPPDAWSLMRAFSMGLYYNYDKYKEIQQEIQTFFRKLIKSNKLPKNFTCFNENLHLLKEFLNKPYLHVFDRVNTELFCMKFQKKVVIYWISSDFSLNAQTFNQKFNESIEIFRTKDQFYEGVFTKSFIKTKEFCENLVFEIIDKIHTINDIPKRSKHKRSFSDICLNTDNNLEEIDKKAYNPFKNLNPPHDFLQLATTDAKKTPNISNFSSFDQISSDSFNFKSDSISPKKNIESSISPNYLKLSEKCPKLPLNLRNDSKIQIKTGISQLTEIPIHKKKFTGHLKFFDESKNYGFFIIDDDKTEIFVHNDDLAKAKITKEILREIKLSHQYVKFAFNSITYIGKYNKSRKAIDIEMLNYNKES